MTTPAQAIAASKPPQTAPPVVFQRLQETKPGEICTGLFYGGSKTGKTWILATAGDRTLFIDTGDGITTLQSPLFKKNVGANPIVVSIREKLDINGIPDEAEAYNIVCDVIDYAIANYGKDFDTICLDDMSALRRFALFQGLSLNQQLGKSGTLSRIQKSKLVVPAIQDYGTEMSLIEQLCAGTISICKRYGKHFFIAAHQRYLLEKPKDDKGNPIIGEPQIIKEIRPAVTGSQFPDTISGMFDNVWRTEKVGGGSEGTAYRVRVYGDEQKVGGSRSAGVFPTVITNPNLALVIEAIKTGRPYEELAKAAKKRP